MQQQDSQPSGPVIRVANEFADVLVQKVMTRNGERLEIRSPKRGLHIRLDAVELESLTWQTPATFSGFLEGSIGPSAAEGDPPGVPA